MLVQLIPFFLAANMSSEDVSSWSRGPELEFDLKFWLKQRSFVLDLPSVSYNMTIKIKCRPKGTDSLSCATMDAKARVVTTNPDEVRNFEHLKRNYMDLKFNENGIESITADELAPCEKINMLKKIHGVLSIGANLKEQDRVFETQEDIMMGRCSTSIYQIKTTPQEENEDHPPNLDLIVTSLEMPNEKTTIEISKVRDPDTCNGTTKYFEYTEQFDTRTEVTYAVSKMIITSPGTFKSYSDYRGEVTNDFKNDTIGGLEELFHLELVSVKEATDDPYEVEHPSVQSPMLIPCASDIDEL